MQWNPGIDYNQPTIAPNRSILASIKKVNWEKSSSFLPEAEFERDT
jgi:hypothetical protein